MKKILMLLLVLLFLTACKTQEIEQIEIPQIEETPEVEPVVIEIHEVMKNIIYIRLEERQGFTHKFPHFTQEEITIKAGESITFVNEDTEPHLINIEYYVTEGNNKTLIPLRTTKLWQGDSETIKFDFPGEAEITDLWSSTLNAKAIIE